MSKTILVPIDFSDTSDAALDYAIDLAKRLDSRIVLMHAFEIPLVGFPDGVLAATAEIASRILAASQKALDTAMEKRKDCGVQITAMLKQADPREAIVSTAATLDAELVVMGTHGRRGLAHALIGSVAENVVRTSTVPVLTVRMERPLLKASA
jgi:nucleotide-binding universal stress UspA family protein